MNCANYGLILFTIAGVLGGSSIFFSLAVCAPTPEGYCEGWITEKGREQFSEPTTFVISITVFPFSIVSLVFVIIYRRNLYVDEALFTIGSKRREPEARKCKIFGKHPYIQKYHAKKIHNLEISKLEDNFENCGCSLCYQRIIQLAI